MEVTPIFTTQEIKLMHVLTWDYCLSINHILWKFFCLMQRRLWSEATFCGTSSGSTLFTEFPFMGSEAFMS